MRFIWDEGRDMLAIHNIVANKDLTLFGPYNEIGGKRFFWRFSLLLDGSCIMAGELRPHWTSSIDCRIGSAECWTTVLADTKNYSKQVALGTTALYAVSPLVVHYVQWPWNPNTTPFLHCCFCALERLKTKKSVLWSGTAGLLLGLAFQLHYFTIALDLHGFWRSCDFLVSQVETESDTRSWVRGWFCATES